METNNNMTELEQMREQMAAFKNRLDKQQIINERLVRNSMGSKMSWIKNFVWIEIAILPLLLLFFAQVFHVEMGLSWWLFAFLAIGTIADVIGDYIINCIPKSQLMSGDLVETSQRLMKMKKQRGIWFAVGMVFVTIWLVWFIIEIVMRLNIGSKCPDHNFAALVIIIGLAVGAIVGYILAWLLFRKMQKTNSELIAQIEQVTHED